MALDLIDIVEKLVKISLQSFEGQINALNCLGYHRDRNKLIDNLNQMVLHLLEVVKKEEECVVKDVAAMTENALGESAIIRNTIVNFHRENGHDPDLKELADFITVGHNDLTKDLDRQETKVAKEISERFGAMKTSAQNLLSRVENIRRC